MGQHAMDTFDCVTGYEQEFYISYGDVDNVLRDELATLDLSLYDTGLKVINTPTCNYCGELMGSQVGKFGKFYMCNNSCKEQKTVSESYWLKMKERLNNVKR